MSIPAHFIRTTRDFKQLLSSSPEHLQEEEGSFSLRSKSSKRAEDAMGGQPAHSELDPDKGRLTGPSPFPKYRTLNLLLFPSVFDVASVVASKFLDTLPIKKWGLCPPLESV